MLTKKKRNVLALVIENLVLIVTVGFTAYVFMESPREVFQEKDLLRWLLAIVGLLATSELIQRLFQLRRIEDLLEKYNEVIVKSGLSGAAKVYTQRVDARSDIEPIIYAEKQEITIIAGTLGGMFLHYQI